MLDAGRQVAECGAEARRERFGCAWPMRIPLDQVDRAVRETKTCVLEWQRRAQTILKIWTSARSSITW